MVVATDQSVLQNAADSGERVYLGSVFAALYKAIGAEDKEDNAFIERIIEYVNAHFGQRISTNNVAAYMNMSVGYFCRFFKEKSGQTFTEWLNDIRIEKVKELLCDESTHFYEITDKVGYPDYKTLSNNFRKAVHMTLGQYKKHIMNNGGKL